MAEPSKNRSRFFSWLMVAAVASQTMSIGVALEPNDPSDEVLPPPVAPPAVERSKRSSLTHDELVERLFASEERLNWLEDVEAARKDKESEVFRNVSNLTMAAEELKKEEEKKKAEPPKEKKWFERISMRGYTQVRYNHVTHRDTESAAAHYVGDSSIGEDQSFLIRRARIIFFGDMNEHVSIYLQPDFASSVSGAGEGTQFCQIRDFYSDLHITTDKVHRFRVGQSKVPYGWENLQSSQNRLALDRNDAFNSEVRNERDLGVFYYYTPEDAQEIFKYVMDNNLKGSGNYGVFGFGFYNGQGGSLRERNDDLHMVARLALPHRFENGQIIETGVQGILGKYTVQGTGIRPLGAGALATPAGTAQTGEVDGWTDERLGWTFVVYPQPIGFQTEWTIGRGPGLNDAQTAIEEQALYGGYAQFFYKYDTDCHGTLFPFARWSYFQGGFKSEANAPIVDNNEWELGTEWQFNKYVEFTTSYLMTDRTNTAARTGAGQTSYGSFDGHVLRFQLQFNY